MNGKLILLAAWSTLESSCLFLEFHKSSVVVEGTNTGEDGWSSDHQQCTPCLLSTHNTEAIYDG